MNSKRKIILIFIVAIAIVTSIAQLFFGKNSFRQQESVKRSIERYQLQIDSLQLAIDSCDKLIDSIQNDSLYKEFLLRTKYGMSRKGEQVFQLVDYKN